MTKTKTNNRVPSLTDTRFAQLKTHLELTGTPTFSVRGLATLVGCSLKASSLQVRYWRETGRVRKLPDAALYVIGAETVALTVAPRKKQPSPVIAELVERPTPVQQVVRSPAHIREHIIAVYYHECAKNLAALDSSEQREMYLQDMNTFAPVGI